MEYEYQVIYCTWWALTLASHPKLMRSWSEICNLTNYADVCCVPCLQRITPLHFSTMVLATAHRMTKQWRMQKQRYAAFLWQFNETAANQNVPGGMPKLDFIFEFCSLDVLESMCTCSVSWLTSWMAGLAGRRHLLKTMPDLWSNTATNDHNITWAFARQCSLYTNSCHARVHTSSDRSTRAKSDLGRHFMRRQLGGVSTW